MYSHTILISFTFKRDILMKDFRYFVILHFIQTIPPNSQLPNFDQKKSPFILKCLIQFL